MNNSIEYIENEEGLLIPQIEMPSLSNLGKYGTIFKNYMKEHKGYQYNRLIRNGEIEDYFKNLNEIATSRIIDIVEVQFLKSKYATSSDTMEIYQEKESLKKSAEEIVISEIIAQIDRD